MTGEPLDPRHHRAYRRQVDLVVAAVSNIVPIIPIIVPIINDTAIRYARHS